MKTLIDSGVEVSDDNCSLLLEAGKDYCSYAYWNKTQKKMELLRFASFDELNSKEEYEHLLNELSRQQFAEVIIASAFSSALLIPSKYFTHDYSLLEIVYDDPSPAYKHDSIPEWQMVVAYALPEFLHTSIRQNFSGVRFSHVYTCNIKTYNGFVADKQLLVNFTPTSFSVIVRLEAAIHLAQTYSYKTPLDVVYYLLKICSEFGIEQNETHVVIAGLIEQDSALYKELEQYFSHLHFSKRPDLQLPQSEHPAYYFHSLYNLAACVS